MSDHKPPRRTRRAEPSDAAGPTPSRADAAPPAKAASRANYHHGDLRGALIAAADALLDAGGPDAVSLREVARRVGVTAPATYRHFADKESLLAAVAERGFDAFAAAMGAAAARAAGPGAPMLAEMAQAYVDFALARPGRFRLLFGPTLADRSRHPSLQAAVERASVGFRGAATAMGPQAPVATMLRGWAMVHGLTQLILDGMLPGHEPRVLVQAMLARPPDDGPPG